MTIGSGLSLTHRDSVLNLNLYDDANRKRIYLHKLYFVRKIEERFYVFGIYGPVSQRTGTDRYDIVQSIEKEYYLELVNHVSKIGKSGHDEILPIIVQPEKPKLSVYFRPNSTSRIKLCSYYIAQSWSADYRTHTKFRKHRICSNYIS